MTDDIIDETPEIWGKRYSTDSSTVERDYDRFAETGTYDETFDEWGYVGPDTAAVIVRNYVPLASRVLDAACGSGLTGIALRRLGYAGITGIDISSSLLGLAEQTGAYERVERVDMQVFALLDHMRRNDLSTFESSEESGEAWSALLAMVAEQTLFGRTDSWYMAANIPGKRRQLMDFAMTDVCLERIDACAAEGYDGFEFT